MRKFHPGDILQYIDDGSFPSLHMYKCKFLEYDKRFLRKNRLIHVEFVLNSSGTILTYHFDPKKFILIKSDFQERKKRKKSKRYIYQKEER